MALEIKSSKGLSEVNGIKCLVYAPSGHGKTSLLKTTGRTFLVSAEKGELSLNDAENVDVVHPTNMAELKEAYDLARTKVDEYDTIAIDSITEIGEMIVSELKKDPEFSSMKDGMKMWMKFSEIMLSVAKSFRDINGANVVIIALSETRKEKMEDKLYPMIPANKVQLKLASLYDEVLYLNVGDDGKRELITQPTDMITAKDRSSKLLPIEDADLGKIFDKINNK